jgi:hypothetical protein
VGKYIGISRYDGRSHNEVIIVGPYTFLSALPALLGLTGFVLYQILGTHKSGDEISLRIVAKLRCGLGGDAPPDLRLTPKQVGRLLEQQHRFREIAGEQDFRLLKQTLTQQFVITVLVYVLAVGFCSWSVYLFIHSSPQQKKENPRSEVQLNQSQSSMGKNSPNVSSTGGGPVTVTIQDRATPSNDGGK